MNYTIVIFGPLIGRERKTYRGDLKMKKFLLVVMTFVPMGLFAQTVTPGIYSAVCKTIVFNDNGTAYIHPAVVEVLKTSMEKYPLFFVGISDKITFYDNGTACVNKEDVQEVFNKCASFVTQSIDNNEENEISFWSGVREVYLHPAEYTIFGVKVRPVRGGK